MQLIVPTADGEKTGLVIDGEPNELAAFMMELVRVTQNNGPVGKNSIDVVKQLFNGVDWKI